MSIKGGAGGGSVKGFRRWLASQRYRDDSVGDLACDLRRDRCADGITTRAALYSHIRGHHGVCHEALGAWREAWREFAEAKARQTKRMAVERGAA